MQFLDFLEGLHMAVEIETVCDFSCIFLQILYHSGFAIWIVQVFFLSISCFEKQGTDNKEAMLRF